MVAIPFAVLVSILVRGFGANPWWVTLTAAIITMLAFVCAVNAAIWIDGHVGDVAKAVRTACCANLGSLCENGFPGAVKEGPANIELSVRRGTEFCEFCR